VQACIQAEHASMHFCIIDMSMSDMSMPLMVFIMSMACIGPTSRFARGRGRPGWAAEARPRSVTDYDDVADPAHQEVRCERRGSPHPPVPTGAHWRRVAPRL
jgi:hypothetical protein